MGIPAENARAREGEVARRATWLRITARMGVWGLIAATTPALTELVGAPMDPSVIGPIGAAGLLTSGVGVLLSSALVLRALPPGLRPLKLAAIAGIPFGLALMSGGAAVLRPLGPFVNVIDAAGPAVVVVGVVLVLFLVVAFVRGRTDKETE